MAHLSGIQIGKQARALAAALALGGAILSLSPGQTAHAARGMSNEAGDTDTGGGAPGRPTTNTRRENTGDNGVRCAITRPDGTVEFYLWGDTIILGGKRYYCTSSGHWMVTNRTAASEVMAPGGGVYTQAP
jgi:hypothetical protein